MSEDSGRKPSKKEIEETNRKNRRLAIGGLVATTGIAAGGIYLASQEHPKSLKETILQIQWKDLEKDDQVRKNVELLAKNYIQLTGTKNLKLADLIEPGKTTIVRGAQKFIEAINQVEPGFKTSFDQWGYAHFASRKTFFDLQALTDQAKPKTNQPGLALVDALWHEWSHLDVVERTQGQLINNPQTFFPSPNSGKNELFKRYRGGAIYTETYFGFLRFEEVWNETLIVRRMIEQLGLSEVAAAGNYYLNGVDFFPQLTAAAGISLAQLYQLHTSSDLEGLATIIGQKLPGNDEPLVKGVTLFNGIHQSNSQLIQQTGALTLLR